MSQAADFERLGSFYLGRQLRADGSVGPEPLLYEARDLAEEVERQRSQRTSEAVGTAISVGGTVLGALFGRKLGTGSVGRAATAARGASRTAREHGDVARAIVALAAAEAELGALDVEFQAEAAALRQAGGEGELAEWVLRPRKADSQVERVALVWRPYWLGADGQARPTFA
jgi:hypothetical protein